jgi:hypothetical protein
LARACECKPDGGYTKPTFTGVTFAHLLFGGHLNQQFAGQSYFNSTERVGQALVDEVVRLNDRKNPDEGNRRVYGATLGRAIGFFYDPITKTWVATNRVRVVTEKDNCTSTFRAGNEVVTMFPIPPNKP